MPLSWASALPISPSLFSMVTTTKAPSSGPLKVARPPTSVISTTAPANNRRLRRLIEEFCLNTDRYTHVEMSKATGKEDPQADHYRILEAARRRDTAAVVEMLEAHILDTKRELLALARAQEQGELLSGARFT
ncbi:FCD domain-containing protein [Vogesella oryzae]|uniref:FCD domain-containing protein n=1 Tax=Vogesella oryzae TaxID=1735285 RepID=UPI003CCD64C8